ncbi:hypothetical protein DI272_20045 [Streptomyces sp. Act143]|nr:hypothetical protein DI272_20045 [Streptomyces sp. Act143]
MTAYQVSRGVWFLAPWAEPSPVRAAAAAAEVIGAWCADFEAGCTDITVLDSRPGPPGGCGAARSGTVPESVFWCLGALGSPSGALQQPDVRGRSAPVIPVPGVRVSPYAGRRLGVQAV